eukprot:jgi/Orpsp1_1/1181622/evm.model.c7180000077965.1
MVREIKNLVGTSSTSFASLNNNYLANGSSAKINSVRNYKSNEMNRNRRLPSTNTKVQQQSYYRRAENNGIKQIVKETKYTNKFNKNYSLVPETNPTNFDSINNLYQNILKLLLLIFQKLLQNLKLLIKLKKLLWFKVN